MSESLFDSENYTEFVVTKCLKYLKNIIAQKNNGKEIVPFRLRSYLMNEELLDDFQVYPSKSEYTNLLADLVSLCFNVKVCLYTYGGKSGPQLKMSVFANNKQKVINIARFRNIYFVA